MSSRRSWALILPVLALLQSGGHASAQEVSNPIEEASPLVKGLTFEVASSALETGLFLAFFGGGLATAGPVMALNFGSSLATYMVNDYAWAASAAPDEPDVAAKAVSFRALTIMRSSLIGSVFGGAKALATLSYTATFSVFDTALFVGIEELFRKQRDLPSPQLAEARN